MTTRTVADEPVRTRGFDLTTTHLETLTRLVEWQNWMRKSKARFEVRDGWLWIIGMTTPDKIVRKIEPPIMLAHLNEEGKSDE